MKRVYPTVGVGDVQIPTATENDWWYSMETIAPGISEVSTDSGWDWQTIITNAQDFLSALVVTQQQRDLIKANLERAQAGQPPLTASEVGMGLSVGMDASTRKMVFMIAGGALLMGAYAVYANSRRR